MLALFALSCMGLGASVLALALPRSITRVDHVRCRQCGGSDFTIYEIGSENPPNDFDIECDECGNIALMFRSRRFILC